jgi:hypothetical protein
MEQRKIIGLLKEFFHSKKKNLRIPPKKQEVKVPMQMYIG